MALTIRLTPGTVLVSGQKVSIDLLNLLANPTVELEGTIGSQSIGDGAVTTTKLAVGVLSADTAGRARMADSFMTTLKYGDNTVTAAKLDEAARAGTQQYADGTYTTGVYAIALSPAATGYTAGMRVTFKASAANDNSGAGACDLNVNSLGAKNLFTKDGHELALNQIPSGAVIEAVYDGTQFKCEFAARYAVAVADAVVIPATGATTTFAHGLGAAPFRYQVLMVCATNDAATGYVTTDGPIPVEFVNSSNQERAFCVYADATNIKIVRNNNAALLFLNKSNGNSTGPSAVTNFKLIARAEL